MRISDWSSDVCSSDLVARTNLISQRPKIIVSEPFFNAVISSAINQTDHARETDVYINKATQTNRPDTHIAFGSRWRSSSSSSLSWCWQIGRASCRERVCQSVKIWVVDVSLKKK